MNDDKDKEKFKKAIKYNKIGFFTIFLAIMPMVLLDGLIKYILSIIILCIGFYFERQYKWHFCGYIFDTRLKSNELIYCPNCSKKSQ